MTQEQKTKLEQAAKEYFSGDGLDELSPFKAGAQTILDKPSAYGLMPVIDSMEHIEESGQNWGEVVDNLKSENQRFRAALERIYNQMDKGISANNCATIAKEALKQQIMKAKAMRNLHYQGERILTEGKIYQGEFIKESDPASSEYMGMFRALDDQGTPIDFIVGLDVEIIEE